MRVAHDPSIAARGGDGEKQHRTRTADSASSDVESSDPPKKKQWYRRFTLNPLRLQKIPPVPEERTVSREYGASFLSQLIFQWMSPLMKVRILTSRTVQLFSAKLTISGRLSPNSRAARHLDREPQSPGRATF